MRRLGYGAPRLPKGLTWEQLVIEYLDACYGSLFDVLDGHRAAVWIHTEYAVGDANKVERDAIALALRRAVYRLRRYARARS